MAKMVCMCLGQITRLQRAEIGELKDLLRFSATALTRFDFYQVETDFFFIGLMLIFSECNRIG